ncbi:hypothetical protein GY14_06245 [Delftia tsuruhatensis]|nr:hypothetical protein GY14_06245 [Delftia tsuruhatensis]
MTMAKSNPPQKPAAAVTAATDVAKGTPDTTGQLQQDGQNTAGSAADTGQVTAAEPGAGSAGNAAGLGDNAQLVPTGASDQTPLLHPDQVQQGDPIRAYIVDSVPIRHNGEYFCLGERIELAESDAFRLGGLVTLASPDTKE